jgi:hypothetical protein
MSALYRIIACLLITAQALVGAGLGPRAVCKDPDGSTCVDSVLSPCCCHRQQHDPCCVEEEAERLPVQHAGQPQLAAACQCICAPVAQPNLLRPTNGNNRLTLDVAGTAVTALALPAMTPLAPWPERGRPVWTGPPRARALAHLDCVILRL